MSHVVVSWASLVLMTVMIIMVVGTVDWFIQSIVPIRHLREADDGIADLSNGDPITLVVGSSHARTFYALGQELSRRTGRNGEFIAIPLEAGKLTSYLWLLEHRVWPLLDAKAEDGRKVHGRLRKFVLVTEWWDSCDDESKRYWNLPSRAWDFSAYADDVERNGFTSFNRNFLWYHAVRAFDFSVLMNDRLGRRLLMELRREVGGIPPGLSADEYANQVSQWRDMVEAGASCIGAADQMQALEAIVRAARIRGLDVRIVLFPRKPDTITPKAESTTLRMFREMVEEVARRNGARVLDMTLASPLQSTDFMDDFDHVSPEGNLKFADWALKGDFSDLLNASPDGVKDGARTP
jgi:hypothetical protein